MATFDTLKPASPPRTSGIDILHGRIYHAHGRPLSFTDPAEYFDFGRPVAAPDAARFDGRSDAQLEQAAFAEATALERERALWELADRRGSQSHDVVARFLEVEPERAPRVHALWLLQRTATAGTLECLSQFLSDDDVEVADWARLLSAELSGTAIDPIARPARVLEEGPFDQTLPLIIAGTTLVTVPLLGRIRVTLSPLWFESILGRVMACTNQATFQTDLVIEKALPGLHADGSIHHEIFMFKGLTYQLAPNLFEHHYESVTVRPFYPSGTVEEGDAVPVAIPLSRVAGTEIEKPKPPGGGQEPAVIGDGARSMRAAEHGYVRSVRGRYTGWAAVNLNAVIGTGTVPPGAVQLSNPTDPLAGPLTNAVLFGAFRGKIADHDGDGALDVNTIRCHGTPDGVHDLHCDGTRACDPFLRWGPRER